MNIEYIIIQAGGKGTRLHRLTANKPKGIVPIHNLPIIFHLFKKFPDKKFIVIGDYRFDVLEKYLAAFCDVQYLLVNAEGTGTCGGLRQAFHFVHAQAPFALIWSDLLLPDQFSFVGLQADTNYMGISKDFICRWSYKENRFTETPSAEYGVAGLFIFRDKRLLDEIPLQGEFVKWLDTTEISFAALPLNGTKEVGTMEAFQEEAFARRCRPFNRLTFANGIVQKSPLDEQGKKLAAHETAWYKEVIRRGLKAIPEILSYEPLTMREISGQNIFEANLTREEKKAVLDHLIAALRQLHGYEKKEADIFSIQEAYYNKTLKRIERVRDLIPFSDQKYIRVNGKKCRNIFFFRKLLQSRITELCYDTEFALIHGDCTFSNTMVDENLTITFLDPRGYFGYTSLYGDVYYDWAKLYYSITGDYDQFNNKNFNLQIKQGEIVLEIETNGWKDMEDYYFSLIPQVNTERLKLIHAIIWISLATYAWEDYDSICGAFYNGIYYLEDLL